MQDPRNSTRGELVPAESGVENPLGVPIAVFNAKVTTRLIVAACGFVLLAGGVWLLFAMGATGPGPWVLPFGLVILGLAYFMGNSGYLICPDGVIRMRFGQKQQCRWDELREAVDVHIKQGLVSSRRCDLVKKNGARMVLTNLGIDNFAAMLDLIRQQAQSHGVPWKEEQQAVR